MSGEHVEFSGTEEAQIAQQVDGEQVIKSASSEITNAEIAPSSDPFYQFGTYRIERDLGNGYSEDSHGGLFHRDPKTGERIVLRLSKWD